MTGAGRWLPTAAHVRAVLCAAVGVGVAVLARRPDLLVVATPFVVIALWSVLARPTRVPVVDQSLGHAVVHEGQVTRWHVSVVDEEGLVEDVAVVLEAPERIDQEPELGQRAVSLPVDGSDGLAVTLRPVRWGRHKVMPAVVVASSAWGAFRWIALGTGSRTVVALPQALTFDAATNPVRSPGLVGLSRSPRQGSGTEFASIRPFQPGDRLRRIHWPQTLRTGVTHVRSTWADNDRHVVLLLDALADIGVSDGVDGRSSSLDVAMRAAAAVARHHVDDGDRVSLVVMTPNGVLRVPPGSGHRHLRRILEILATVQPVSSANDTGRVPRGLHSGELVILFSPLVSTGSVDRAAALADRGLGLVVVDCLPPTVDVDTGGDPYAEMSWRIESLERARRLRLAGEAGIAVVPWVGPGSLDLVLRDLQRHVRGRVGGRQ